MAQVTEDGGVRFLTREQVVEELAANPEAEIYNLDGKRLKLLGDEAAEDEFGLPVEIAETGDRDGQAIPPAATRDLVPEEKIAYKR